MRLYYRVKPFAWILLLSLFGTVIQFTAGEDDLVIIKVNGTSARYEKCNGLNELLEYSHIEISTTALTAPCTCTLSSPQMTSVSSVRGNMTKTLTNQTEDNIAFQVLLPCTAEDNWKPVKKLSLMLIPSEQKSTQVLVMSDLSTECELPITVISREIFHMQCQLSAKNSSDMEMSHSSTKTAQNVSIVVLKGRNMLKDNTTLEEPRGHVNSPLLHSRPAHNNVVVVAVICVLVGVIILAGSLILISLVMHRKRLARRLAIHLRNLEEAGHPEAVPLTDTPDSQTDQHVRLVGLRRLDSSGCEIAEKLKENGFQPVSPNDVTTVLPNCYQKKGEDGTNMEELARASDTISISNESSMASCDKTSVGHVEANETAIVEDDGAGSSGDSESFQDSIGDNLEQSLTGTDSGSNKEDKSVQTLNTDSYYQLFPSVLKIKIPRIRWRTKSCDSEYT